MPDRSRVGAPFVLRDGRTQNSDLDLYLEQQLSVGNDLGHGNVVGIQPYLVPQDYRSGADLHAKLKGYLEAARRSSWLQEQTVVVFPEHIGTWLVVAEERDSIHEARTVAAAMRILLLNRPFTFVRGLLAAIGRATDIVRYTLFRTKAPAMARIYHDIFAQLARDYTVTIVAGSVVLPAPAVKGGILVPGDGPLHNVSVVYRPDGLACENIVHKVFPISSELPFIRGGTAAALPTFDTPAGRLGVLICADSWYPACYEALHSQRVDLVVVPSFLGPDGVWTRPWSGYDGASAPGDVDPRDVDQITEQQAWIKYALPGRIGTAGTEWGINVFLRGALWDLGSDGQTMVVHEGDVIQAEATRGAVIVNMWLDWNLEQEK